METAGKEWGKELVRKGRGNAKEKGKRRSRKEVVKKFNKSRDNEAKNMQEKY